MTEVQSVFDKLYDCKIEKLQYDCFNACFILEAVDLETNEKHNLIFNDVVSCLFSMTGFEGEICTEIYPELSSILLKKIKLNTKDKCISSYPLEYNICIEIMDRVVLINAKSVLMDSVVYDLEK